MRPQFPGMDPWLEHPDLWSDVHTSLITAIRDELMPRVLPRYTTPIPDFPIPLLPKDTEPILELNNVLHSLIDRARYDLSIDYHKAPQPPLRPEDEPWAEAIIARAADQTPETTPGNGTAP